MKEYVLELVKRIGNKKKLSFDDTNHFLTLVKEKFGDNEASGVLNMLLASNQVRTNIEPKDDCWKGHFEQYNKLSIEQKFLIDALADGLLS